MKRNGDGQTRSLLAGVFLPVAHEGDASHNGYHSYGRNRDTQFPSNDRAISLLPDADRSVSTLSRIQANE